MPPGPLLARFRRLLGANEPSVRRERLLGATAVYVVDLNGLHAEPDTLRQVSADGEYSQAALSPSGHVLLYWGRTRPVERHGVWLTNLDGDTRRLSASEALEGHPAWCPDERSLVCFSSMGHGETEPWTPARQFSVDRSPRSLWMIDAATGQRSRITDGPWVDESPCVTPDGAGVCFVSNRSGRLNLWSISTDGGALRQLTDGELDYRPAIAPDGSRLAWFTRASHGGSHQLALASWPEIQPLALELERRFRWIHGPHWFGDSRRLLVHGLAEGEPDASLWVLDTTNGRVERLQVPGFASLSHGSLDLTGRRLAFDSRDPLPQQR